MQNVAVLSNLSIHSISPHFACALVTVTLARYRAESSELVLDLLQPSLQGRSF